MPEFRFDSKLLAANGWCWPTPTWTPLDRCRWECVRCCHSVQAKGNYETRKYTGTEPSIVDKRLQAHAPIATATQSVLITSRYRSTNQAQIVPTAQMQPPADDAKYRQCESLQHRVGQELISTEKNGGRFAPDLAVIGPISHRIHGIVSDRPQQISAQEPPGQCRYTTGLCGKCHRNPPGKSNP